MAGFENYPREAAELEREIVRRGLILGIDWGDDAAVRLLAREALACRLGEGRPGCDPETDPRSLAKIELFGLAQLMLRVMEEGAQNGMAIHGGPVWKTFGRALWGEYEVQRTGSTNSDPA